MGKATDRQLKVIRKEGGEAFVCGVCWSENPFLSPSPSWLAWIKGWVASAEGEISILKFEILEVEKLNG